MGVVAPRSILIAVLAMAVVNVTSLTVEAAPDTAAAARAFANGQSAQMSGEHRLAAEQFELADSIAPSAAALRSAARSRFLAKSYPRAATHAVRLLELYRDQESLELANEILDRTRATLVEFKVECNTECTIERDGKVLSVTSASSHHFFTKPGKFALAANFETGPASPQAFTSQAGHSYRARFVAPTVAPEQKPAASRTEPEPAKSIDARNDEPRQDKPRDRGNRMRRAHPGWVYGGIAITAGLGAGTIWSGIDTRNSRDDFEANPSRDGWEDGRSKQLRTNILIAATATVGAVTVLLAAIGTDWKKARRKKKTKQDRRANVTWGPTGLAGRF